MKNFKESYVYKTNLISTIVDSIGGNIETINVYKTNLISTIVDREGSVSIIQVSIRLI